MTRRAWIVSYDIANPKRWRRVHALLKRKGEPLQLSVWVVQTDARGAARLEAQLRKLIDAQADRLHLIPAAPEARLSLGAARVGIV